MPLGKAMKKGLRDQVLERDKHCVRNLEGNCSDDLTIEHAFGRKYERLWNCITLCSYHHSVNKHQGGEGLNKEINRFYAYQNAIDHDLKEFKLYAQMKQEKAYLTKKYQHLL